MTIPQPASEDLSLVVVGTFSPSQLTPAWFARHNLLPGQDADSATVEVVVPQLAVYTVSGMRFEIQLTRLTVSTNLATQYELVRDLVIGVFRTLPETPVTAMGINCQFQFRLASESEWHNFGHRLAPKGDWDGVLANPGLLSLTMLGQRDDGRSGYIRVRVEPSTDAKHAVSFSVNDHYVPGTSAGASPTTFFQEVLETLWNASLARARSMTTKLLEATLGDTSPN